MKKVLFFAFFFLNISKTTKPILEKEIERNHGISVYKKSESVMREHLKNNYILQDINYFVKMSVSTLVSTFPNFMKALAQKLV